MGSKSRMILKTPKSIDCHSLILIDHVSQTSMKILNHYQMRSDILAYSERQVTNYFHEKRLHLCGFSYSDRKEIDRRMLFLRSFEFNISK